MAANRIQKEPLTSAMSKRSVTSPLQYDSWVYRLRFQQMKRLGDLSTLMGKYGEEGDSFVRIQNSGDDYFRTTMKTCWPWHHLQNLPASLLRKSLRYDLGTFARYVLLPRWNNFRSTRYQIRPVWLLTVTKDAMILVDTGMTVVPCWMVELSKNYRNTVFTLRHHLYQC